MHLIDPNVGPWVPPIVRPGTKPMKSGGREPHSHDEKGPLGQRSLGKHQSAHKFQQDFTPNHSKSCILMYNVYCICMSKERCDPNRIL